MKRQSSPTTHQDNVYIKRHAHNDDDNEKTGLTNDLDQYKSQLAEIENLISSTPEPDASLLKLKNDIIQLISLTKELSTTSDSLYLHRSTSEWKIGDNCMAPFTDNGEIFMKPSRIVDIANDKCSIIPTIVGSEYQLYSVDMNALLPLVTAPPESLTEGTKVYAIWVDNYLYPANIIGQQSDGNFSVRYEEYNNISSVNPSNIILRHEETRSDEVNDSDKPIFDPFPPIDIAFNSIQGQITRDGYPSDKPNQDCVLVVRAIGDDPGIDFFAVMDGHGAEGHEVSQYIHNKLPILLARHFQNLKEDTVRTLRIIFQQLNKLLIESGEKCERLSKEMKSKKGKQLEQAEQKLKQNVDSRFSGSTLVSALRIRDKLYIANVGDSRCILCKQEHENPQENPEQENPEQENTTPNESRYVLQSVPLSIDHKPENERERIRKAGGKVEFLYATWRIVPPWTNSLGLSISRSMGDMWGQGVGLIAEPDIIEYKLQKNDIMLVLVSDGVTGRLSNDEICQLAYSERKKPILALDKLLNCARQGWIEKSGGRYVDDISGALILFNLPDEEAKIPSTPTDPLDNSSPIIPTEEIQVDNIKDENVNMFDLDDD